MNRLYQVRMGLKDTKCFLSTTTSESSRCHARLGHINMDTIKSMVQKDLVIGIPHITFEKVICGSCLLGKQTRHVFPQATSYRADKILELVHGSLCGPISPSIVPGNKYVFVLIDDHSRYMWTILLKEKTEALEKFKKFRILVEQDLGHKMQNFRTNSVITRPSE